MDKTGQFKDQFQAWVKDQNQPLPKDCIELLTSEYPASSFTHLAAYLQNKNPKAEKELLTRLALHSKDRGYLKNRLADIVLSQSKINETQRPTSHQTFNLPKTLNDDTYISWLKSMSAGEQKEEIEGIIGAVSNEAVRDAEMFPVVSETLAELLEKQGKYLEAINIYKELSLIFPLKTTFFASKIENLKEKI